MQALAASPFLELRRRANPAPPFASRNLDRAAASVSRRIDPLTLRLFVSVIDTGTIAGAATRESIAPSAVSKRLSDLEQHLKAKLLARSNRGIEPTSAGRELLRLARAALNELDNIYWQIKDHASGARGSVRLVANMSAISQFLPERLRTFGIGFPHVDVHVQEQTSAQIVRSVVASEADVGVFVGVGAAPAGVDVFPFRRDELAVVVPRGHALADLVEVSIDDILRYDVVGLPGGSQINQALLAAAREVGARPNCRVQVSSFEAACGFVEAGAGIALAPRPLAERYASIHDICVVSLDEPWAQREFFVCARAADTLTMATRHFVDHLRAN